MHPDWVRRLRRPARTTTRASRRSAPSSRTRCWTRVSRYDIDGVHFDDYFYPYPVAGGLPRRRHLRRSTAPASPSGRLAARQRRHARPGDGASDPRGQAVGEVRHQPVRHLAQRRPPTRSARDTSGAAVLRRPSTPTPAAGSAGLARLHRAAAVLAHRPSRRPTTPSWSVVVRRRRRHRRAAARSARPTTRSAPPGRPPPGSDPAELTATSPSTGTYPQVVGDIHFSAKDVRADRARAVQTRLIDRPLQPRPWCRRWRGMPPPRPHALTAAKPTGTGARLQWLHLAGRPPARGRVLRRVPLRRPPAVRAPATSPTPRTCSARCGRCRSCSTAGRTPLPWPGSSTRTTSRRWTGCTTRARRAILRWWAGRAPIPPILSVSQGLR